MFLFWYTDDMQESDAPTERRRVEGFPATGRRQFASFGRAVGPDESRRYTTDMRDRLAEESQLNDKASADIGLIAMLEPPEQSQ